MPLFLLAFFWSLQQSQATFSAVEAEIIFKEMAACLEGENSQFWDSPLSTQAILYDARTNRAACSTNPGLGVFEKQGEVWVGNMPTGPDMRRKVVTWVGQSWTIIRWPLPHEPSARKKETIGKLWYLQVKDLGVPMTAQENAHLKTVEGRLWMRLEWRALAAALQSEGLAQRGAIADAMTFRRQRRNMTEVAAYQEQAAELVDGLAHYTGLMLSGETNPKMWLLDQLDDMEKASDFSKDFPKWSGPAYGLLLDSLRPKWKKSLTANQDLGSMLEVGMKLIIPPAWYEAANLRAKTYNLQQIRRAELERADFLNRRILEYQKRFLIEPHLEIPLSKLPIKEDYANGVDLDGKGLYLQTLVHRDEWGRLVADDGVCLQLEGSKLTLPLPDEISAEKVQGPNWVLFLEPGWEIVDGQREGDLLLVKP